MKYASFIEVDKSDNEPNYLTNFSSPLNKLKANSELSNNKILNDDILFPTEVDIYLNVIHFENII